jgi:FtsP/CotA-like multicopper oxidase with cupredoxin domain
MFRLLFTTAFVVTAMLGARVPAQAPHPHAGPAGAPQTAIVSNDNRQHAGSLADGTLTLELRAQLGVWRPEGDGGRALLVAAFADGSSPPSVPAPLIRVPEGTTIVATIRNELERVLSVHGLCDRGQASCPPVDVPAGGICELRFSSGPAGTYHYWAATDRVPLALRGTEDTQLSGAFIIDPRNAAPDDDRVFVVTEWADVTRDQLKQILTQDDPGAAFMKLRPDVLFTINGRSWPHTERLAYTVGDRVRWRIVNLSSQVYPMHLHGFHYEVDSVGDGTRDEPYGDGQRRTSVTQLVPSGTTMTMTWTPARAGNWLFHCHVMHHVSPTLHIDGSPKEPTAHDDHHAAAGMTGMVLGIRVAPASDADRADMRPARTDEPANPRVSAVVTSTPPRKITLMMQAEPRRFGDEPAFGFQLADASSAGRVPVPGPVLVLERGQPAEITLLNRLPEGTAIHWHGMELDSYYDGVHGWSGTDLQVTPMIEPGASFVVRFMPPRAGTFIYHTHLHDRRQLTQGLYGALLVVEPGERFDQVIDHVLVIGRDGPDPGAPIVINGERAPQSVWPAGVRQRVRLINITPDDIVSVVLQTNEGPVTWQPVAKDGASLPVGRRQPGPAKQVIGVGETYDFEFDTPAGRRNLWIEVRSPAGKWQAQGHVIVK